MKAKLVQKIIHELSYSTGPSQQFSALAGRRSEWECFLHGQDDSFYKKNF